MNFCGVSMVYALRELFHFDSVFINMSFLRRSEITFSRHAWRGPLVGLMILASTLGAAVQPTLIDGTFQPDIAEFVLPSIRLAVQPDGKILVAGNSSGVSLVSRLNPDGSRDPSFNLDPAFHEGFSNLVRGIQLIALQGDGKVLLTETFQAVERPARWRMVRLNADGSLDRTF